ncbi:alkyl hydroperoxide reductase subunit F [Alkalilimnicola sp. S0819]|uniref:alkyl hydroperoxide reductase subunit F n=1 Tax=Alkalilimnicola sp. S0819 TaxID=2613922 RepID=UPI0012629ED0|nr:alkyl hydroperoxide reductase subunit F [Alkalilimnicola sp. S0819]KAB7627768.1 alkyl hydroperoxide reductase subunit F [Alkalilimnicola sp. S0819]MPQ15392.1 alkyl hydroperoxide reductase subunit F [Alkalilimnicola sp. S0819]
MLDANLKTQLQGYLEKLSRPIELVATLDDGAKSREMSALLNEISALSDKISLREDGDYRRAPSFSVAAQGEQARVRFAGIPMGHEFTSLVLALLQAGGHPLKLDDDQIEQIRDLDAELHFETYVSLSCQNCPDVVQALNAMAVLNPNIRHEMIDGALFQDEVEQRQIMAVPTVYLNGEAFGGGRMSLTDILRKVDTGALEREAASLAEKAPYDVLVVGGGPAGAAAAIYAARKGIRTGVVSERFGGQVMDTLAIENFISVQATEGPKLAAALEEHVKSYEVDIMDGQRAAGLVPGKLSEVKLENGASLKAKTVLIATGARWRELNVPGEKEYLGHGVAYCPHCDGPLFKGKRVAVIGGGNSGVEAAIDLAGIVGHVTVLEFGDELRADAVLQKKLHSLPNVDVLTSAQTTEVHGDGKKVNALSYKDRESGAMRRLELDGVFVQIGLLPNTDWLKQSPVTLSKHGEVEVDARGQTSVPGVFACGDVTTVPYKQIVIAMGEGSKAALAAFDHLVRSSVEAEEDETAVA